MVAIHVTEHTVKTGSHTTFFPASGPVDGPLIVFVHGWPELSISWRHQLPCMASLGFRAIAPDMRGYGRSSVYDQHSQYAADHFLDVQTARFEARTKDVDIVIDTIGGEILDRLFKVLKSRGVLVSSVAGPDQHKAVRHRVRGVFVLVTVTTAGLTRQCRPARCWPTHHACR
jgi:alpha-beta hydrolase superfamily lysophospholipase